MYYWSSIGYPSPQKKLIKLAIVKKCGIIIMYIENFIIRMFENDRVIVM